MRCLPAVDVARAFDAHPPPSGCRADLRHGCRRAVDRAPGRVQVASVRSRSSAGVLTGEAAKERRAAASRRRTHVSARGAVVAARSRLAAIEDVRVAVEVAPRALVDARRRPRAIDDARRGAVGVARNRRTRRVRPIAHGVTALDRRRRARARRAAHEAALTLASCWQRSGVVGVDADLGLGIAARAAARARFAGRYVAGERGLATATAGRARLVLTAPDAASAAVEGIVARVDAEPRAFHLARWARGHAGVLAGREVVAARCRTAVVAAAGIRPTGSRRSPSGAADIGAALDPTGVAARHDAARCSSDRLTDERGVCVERTRVPAAAGSARRLAPPVALRAAVRASAHPVDAELILGALRLAVPAPPRIAREIERLVDRPVEVVVRVVAGLVASTIGRGDRLRGSAAKIEDAFGLRTGPIERHAHRADVGVADCGHADSPRNIQRLTGRGLEDRDHRHFHSFAAGREGEPRPLPAP